MAVKRITRRWLFNSFGVVLLLVLLAVVGVSVAISSYYYNYVRQTLTTRVDLAGTTFLQYSQDSAVTDFSALVRDYVASFAAKDRMELMVIDGEDHISFTSSGFLPDGEDSMLDYYRALESGKDGELIGQINGQRVMAVSLLVPVEGQPISAVRAVTSLESIDRQILIFILALAALGAGVLALILFSSSYFISSIVNPVSEIGNTARRIAGGDFATRLERKTDDEIGELCDIINYMAEELGAAEQLKNDFISSVSHELRTPLTAIQGWGETLLGDGGADKEMLHKGMQVIISETGRLSQMVEELLDFSRMQSGRLKLIRARMDVIAELSEAVLMYTERARRENIELICDVDDAVAPVYGDKNKLRQVFVNIIDNAIKYSDSGGKVTVTAEVTPAQVVIVVEDTGIGIRPEDLGQVKTKFFKADTTRRGSGIGLAVADEIITRHDGTLEITSVYGGGTAVTIALPIHRGGELAQVDLAEPQPQPEQEKLF